MYRIIGSCPLWLLLPHLPGLGHSCLLYFFLTALCDSLHFSCCAILTARVRLLFRILFLYFHLSCTLCNVSWEIRSTPLLQLSYSHAVHPHRSWSKSPLLVANGFVGLCFHLPVLSGVLGTYYKGIGGIYPKHLWGVQEAHIVTRGTYHLHGKTGNSSWKIKWFAPFRLGSQARNQDFMLGEGGGGG